ncbi:hypothetical protein BC826DRAFT_1038270, partial [Russula brevipes]
PRLERAARARGGKPRCAIFIHFVCNVRIVHMKIEAYIEVQKSMNPYRTEVRVAKRVRRRTTSAVLRTSPAGGKGLRTYVPISFVARTSLAIVGMGTASAALKGILRSMPTMATVSAVGYATFPVCMAFPGGRITVN